MTTHDHRIVRDAIAAHTRRQGDPQQLAESYGADTLRMIAAPHFKPELVALYATIAIHFARQYRKACDACNRREWYDVILWPWPDGIRLCDDCNDDRHDLEDYSEVEVATRQRARTMAEAFENVDRFIRAAEADLAMLNRRQTTRRAR